MSETFQAKRWTFNELVNEKVQLNYSCQMEISKGSSSREAETTFKNEKFQVFSFSLNYCTFFIPATKHTTIPK